MKRVVSTSKVARKVDPERVCEALGAEPAHCDSVGYWRERARLAEHTLSELVEAISTCMEGCRDCPAGIAAYDLIDALDSQIDAGPAPLTPATRPRRRAP